MNRTLRVLWQNDKTWLSSFSSTITFSQNKNPKEREREFALLRKTLTPALLEESSVQLQIGFRASIRGGHAKYRTACWFLCREILESAAMLYGKQLDGCACLPLFFSPKAYALAKAFFSSGQVRVGIFGVCNDGTRTQFVAEPNAVPK